MALRRILAAAAISSLAAGGALACDYPGPPPDAGEARADTGDILWAAFSDATQRYDHAILGDGIEAGGLRAATADKDGCELSVILPDTRVFEDLAPRIADLDGDGRNEIVVVETDVARGASLAIYGLRSGRLEKLAATPPIGQTHRWLAPLGAADLDGDGILEIAYVDRPHLAKILRVWRYVNGRLTEVAAASGLTSHRIGDAFIQGGFASCGGRAVILTADADWRRVMATRLEGGKLVATDLGPYSGPDSLDPSIACR
ncbi:VCBS repeat-containing protein [Ostreiculturibacter nitratireducens]|uniref:FG-GAP repeat domain-containing protein n=1 Tax=Ostreiculturibacter nitratireducens TaxID=3075226 RepID=UPI0031B57A44